MSAWYAVLWGALASSSLFIGQALADPLQDSRKPTGLLMGFGAPAAVFVSNVPQGVAGTQSLRAAGASSRHVLWGWAILTGVCAAFAGAGYVLSDAIANQGVYVEAFAGGAVLTMLADSMMPEAFRYGGRAVGLFTVLGYMVAAVLAVAQ